MLSLSAFRWSPNQCLESSDNFAKVPRTGMEKHQGDLIQVKSIPSLRKLSSASSPCSQAIAIEQQRLLKGTAQASAVTLHIPQRQQALSELSSSQLNIDHHGFLVVAASSTAIISVGQSSKRFRA